MSVRDLRLWRLRFLLIEMMVFVPSVPKCSSRIESKSGMDEL